MVAAHKIDNIRFEPGIYDIENEIYHKSNGISRSGILLFKKSPLHYWHHYLNNYRTIKEKTDALILGDIFHLYALQPDIFKKKYLIAEDIGRKSNKDKQYWAELTEQAKIENKEILELDLYEQMLPMVDSLKQDQDAYNLIVSGKYEQSLFWSDPETKILCKCRPDIWHSNMICDLKTTTDASKDAFKFDINKYGYHIQAAMMQDAIRVLLNKELDSFFFILVEKKPPFATAIYLLDEKSIEEGRKIYMNILPEYKKCLEKNKWPGYGIKYISLPPFAYKGEDK